ncbi:hypothetical protein BT93_C1788 [Corymbia citriodora subsp. variegata]|nr:hypothetical protein BT93_C1788 [Corymbia citriodora subsp. variegata]
MSKVFEFTGDGDFCPGGSLYPNPKETSLFLSLGRHVDVYFPACKRSRISAPFVFSGDQLKQKKKASIDVLPDECLFEIFRRLPTGQERSACACVSKRWLLLMSNIRGDELCCNKATLPLKREDIPSENKEISGDEPPAIKDDGYLSRVLEGKKATDVRLAAIAVGTSSHGGLGKLLIRGNNSIRGVTDLGLRAVARGCPSLKVLSIWNVSSVGDEGLIEIANGCRQLEKLELRHCNAVSDKALISLAKNCPHLTDISIDSCSTIRNEGLQAIGHNCPNLKSISINNCPHVGDQGIASLLSNTSCVLTKVKLQALHVTDLSLAVIGHYGKSVTDLILVNLQNVSERGFWVMGNGHGLQKLRSFTVTSCQGMTDLGLEALGKGCPNLKQLCVHNCALLSDRGLDSFGKASLSLERLQLEECHRITQYGLFTLLANCGDKLKSLTLVHCLGMKDLNMEPPMLSSCKSLRSLSIRHCPGFGDVSLVMLAKLCPNLQHVDLSGLQAITDAGFIPLLENCDGGLGKINISGCTNLTDKAVSAIAEMHGWTLEVLNLEGCRKVGNTSLVAIAENCPLLNDLDVSLCAVTDFGVAALARAGQLNLQILSISGCTEISEKCLPALRKLGRSLVGLNLQHCSGISKKSVDLLVEQLWRCDILH